MRRVLYFLLLLSLGLNAGLLYDRFQSEDRRSIRRAGWPPENVDELLERHLDRMGGRLSLEPSQRSAIAALLKEHLPKILEQGKSVREARRSLSELYGATELDAEAFRTQVEILTEAQAELDRLVGEAMIAEATVLTPEQRREHIEAMPWGRRPPPNRGR